MKEQNQSIPAAVYLRVSSEMQVEIGSSLPSQLAAIEEYARKNGYQILQEHIYSDDGVSARTADRPDFQRMISAAKKDNPPFQAILCYDNSRFARSREDAIVFKALLRRRGISLRFVKLDFDDNPMGRLMEGLIEIVDQFYSDNLGIETKRGQEQNAKDGYSTGGRPPYGLRRITIKNSFGADKARWEPDPETSLVVKRIYEMYIGGMGYKAIAYALNQESIPAASGGLWSANTLHYILHKNQSAYLGKQIYGREKGRTSTKAGKYQPEDQWVIKENAWEPIITEEMASAAAAKGKKHNVFRRRRGVEEPAPYLLTGKVFCGSCGSALSGTSAGEYKHRYYRCNKSRASGTKGCERLSIESSRLEDTVIEAIKAHLTDVRYLKKVYKDYLKRGKTPAAQDGERIKNIEEAIKRKEDEKKRLLSALMKGIVEEADARPLLLQVKRDIDSLTDEMNLLKAVSLGDYGIEIKDFEEFAETVKTLVTISTRASHRAMIDAWIEKITVNEDSINIVFSIDPSLGSNEKRRISLAESRGFEPLGL